MYDVTSAGGPQTEGAKPVHDYQTFGDYVCVAPCSCFAPGTKVWTMTGRRPIEGIKVGDCVLAQDVESGELAYKPVLGVTIRPAPPTMKMRRRGVVEHHTQPSVLGRWQRLAHDEATRGGRRLHSLSGGVPVEQIETLEAESLEARVAYNLIVADFSTYFVAERGLLVHDNTPRKPTAALLPGLVPAQPCSGDHRAEIKGSGVFVLDRTGERCWFSSHATTIPSCQRRIRVPRAEPGKGSGAGGVSSTACFTTPASGAGSRGARGRRGLARQPASPPRQAGRGRGGAGPAGFARQPASPPRQAGRGRGGRGAGGVSSTACFTTPASGAGSSGARGGRG